MAQTSLSTVSGFPAVEEYLPNSSEHRRRIARQLNRINQGKFNCTLDVTLNANTGSTLITDNRIGYHSLVTPSMALTLSGATALAAGIWFDPPTGKAGSTSATITAHHAVSSATDQTIRLGIFG